MTSLPCSACCHCTHCPCCLRCPGGCLCCHHRPKGLSYWIYHYQFSWRPRHILHPTTTSICATASSETSPEALLDPSSSESPPSSSPPFEVSCPKHHLPRHCRLSCPSKQENRHHQSHSVCLPHSYGLLLSHLNRIASSAGNVANKAIISAGVSTFL